MNAVRRRTIAWVACSVFFTVLAPTAYGQSASLRGQVTDQNGAVVAGAKVTIHGPNNLTRTMTTNESGFYSFTNLAAGEYTVEAFAPSLMLQEPAKISLRSGSQSLNLQLSVFIPEQKITVQDNRIAVSTDSNSNASAQVLRGEDLEALGDSPEDLQEALLALAGPSAGPSGGQIFIDGFSGGQLPSKNSIREIRINQNPFSPEYDKLGFGRIEILTKPGSGKLGGSAYYNFGNQFWNSRNPYAAQKAPFMLHEYGGNLTGPFNKRASYFLDVRRDDINNGSIVNAVVLDPQSLVVTPFTDTPVTRQRRFGFNPRLDYQINQKHTLVARYAFTHSDISDAGIGSFNLRSRAIELINTSHTLQLTETAVLNPSTINETRFQYSHYYNETVPNSSDPALLVLGSFNGGGAQTGRAFSNQNSFELQNNTSIAEGKHFWRFGVRVRDDKVSNISPQNFGGTFTFSGGNTLAPVVINPASCALPPNSTLAAITSIERYRRTLLFQQFGCSSTQVRALGGGATQFSINAGDPAISGNQFDLGFFAGDDWRLSPALTVNLGLRYETQNNIHDRRDFAPRFALAWAPGATAKTARLKTVVRAGFGVFYDRFALANTLAAERYNGVIQQQYVVTNPDFFPIVPPISVITAFQTQQTIQQVSPTLHAPYIIQSAVSVEHQLPHNSTLAITYANAHGLHLLRSQDINAPLPGTFNPLVPSSGVFPLGRPGPVFLMESSGLYNQNQLITFLNSRYNKKVSFSASYVLNYARSNTDGLGTFPANPYDFSGEYGPAATDVRHRFTFNGTIITKWNIRLSPFVVVQSGPPFDITIGRDLYGTTLFNARPGIPTDPSKPGLIQTKYGLLDPNPTAGEAILPRNFGRGPGQLMVNLRVQKIFEFGKGENSGGAATGQPGSGPRGGTPGVFTPAGGASGAPSSSAGHRYSLSISMSIRNIINHTNPGPIIGNITSPLFGLANQPSDAGGFGFSESANNRRFELQTRFTF
ncbi:MAG TPA: carboxypeptidase regulatory-like domain-containing protein [Pyrinomonadaceae bacterium]|nr:carboxypeptidase regulatory-like domain-containing protein [Pyrinomonadaceae bacterium]